MHVVLLLYETNERTTHRDDIVIGVWREDKHTLGVGQRWRWTRRVVGIGLTARPARNRMLQVVEYADVDLVVGAALLE